MLSLNDPYHLVGRTLMDKYRIDALVGLGGMGAVYYAYHSGIDRRVAFKILQPNIALGDERVVELFEREAKLAGRLTHENIVDVKDAGHTDEGIAYIVMEWLEGCTLDDELFKQGRFSLSRAAGITRQIAAALGEAHGKNVIHRDLKPGNIMLIDSPGGGDHVKVLDFGIGKAIEETTASSPVSTVVGTPHYASPEQLTIGGRIDGRSDIYSLGIILYRMLGGKLPFNSSSMGEVLQMQLSSAPPPLSKLRPDTPVPVERLINSMLAKDPAGRPQNVAEVVAKLDQAIPFSEEDAELPDAPRSGETTIQRGHNLVDRTTEEMYVPPPLRGTFSTNVQPTSRVKSSALYAVIIGGALVATGFGLYRILSDDSGGDGGQDVSAALVSKPSPSTTVNSSPMPSATVNSSPASSATVARAPAPNPTAVVKPTPRMTPRPKDRREESPAPPKREPTDNEKMLAEQHYQQARELHKQIKHQAAIVECDKALKLNPQHRGAQKLKSEINRFLKILNSR
ncbi:MAG TPA: protein kinase [Blastocatellia bacterium]|nr:protein kinase [Blastocatellia bacterium]